MAVFTTGPSSPINMNTFDPTETVYGPVTAAMGNGGVPGATWCKVEDSPTDYDHLYGSIFTDGGEVSSGTLERIESFSSSVLLFDARGLAVEVGRFRDFSESGNISGARAYMLAGNDTVHGAKYKDVLNGYAGDDVLFGYGSADTLYGGKGNDALYGGFGIDTAYGGAGDDTFYVGHSSDVVIEYAEEGTDKVVASVSYALAENTSVQTLAARSGTAAIDLSGNGLANTVAGNSGANLLRGGGGDDVLHGYRGADDLYGDAGDDVLLAGWGLDHLHGGSGGDAFVFDDLADSAKPGQGSDVIADFVPTGDDIIDLSGIDASSRWSGDQQFKFIGSSAFGGADDIYGELRAFRSGAKTIVSADVDGDGVSDFGIELTGAMTLNQSDFVL